MDFSKIDMGELGRHLFARILKATASDGKFMEILEECKLKDEPYTDESFPPNEFSLIKDWDDDDVFDKVRMWRKFEWIRCNEIGSLNDGEGRLQVFHNLIEPRDMKEGLLGDCYFLSALAVLGTKVTREKFIFLNTDEEFMQCGAFCIKFY